MKTRNRTKKIRIGDKSIGGSNQILIQSMCNIKTSNIAEVAAQINRCSKLGADLMRVSILDEDDANALSEIKKLISIPIVADIHFDYRLAIMSIEKGADKIRINPGNIGNEENIKKVVEAAKEKRVPIRIGVNSGSLDKAINNSKEYSAKDLVDSAKKHIDILNKFNFDDIVVSIKGSSIIETIEANRILANEYDYPIHLGITEAGFKDLSLIRSSAGLSPLLLEGIGGTIRISISGEPEDEIVAAKRLLHDLELYPNYPTLISCPTCGRTQVDIINLSKKVMDYLEFINKPITVAIMGCVVNGPGEAKHADIGIAGGHQEFVLFKKGEIIKKVPEDRILETLIEEINNI